MLIRADARALPLRDGCVDCVVTSPPYWGLRDYGSAGQIGLERTPDAYVRDLVAVFAEVRRVLKPEGTVWCNLGDSYAAIGRSERKESPGVGAVQALRAVEREVLWAPRDEGVRDAKFRWTLPGGIKPKDLVGIPWRVAFALQADGWYLRSDIIWSKPNPMPESVTDRPTKAHEYLFLLTKSERYFYDASAIAEPVSAAMLMEMEQGYDGLGLKDYEAAGVQNPSSVKARIIANARRKSWKGSDFASGKTGEMMTTRGHRKGDNSPRNDGNAWNSNDGRGFPCDGATRNRRTVWTVPTMPYAGAHFATMPEKLVEPCILAGCPIGGLVLDPFVGSGTVVAVAQRLGRRGVGVDLSYQQLAKERTAQRGLLYGEETA